MTNDGKSKNKHDFRRCDSRQVFDSRRAYATKPQRRDSYYRAREQVAVLVKPRRELLPKFGATLAGAQVKEMNLHQALPKVPAPREPNPAKNDHGDNESA